MSTELTCEEFVEVVTDYLEGAMSDADRARFEAHLDPCQGCTTYLEQIRSTVETVGALRADDIDPAARETLLSAFRDWKTGG